MNDNKNLFISKIDDEFISDYKIKKSINDNDFKNEIIDLFNWSKKIKLTKDVYFQIINIFLFFLFFLMSFFLFKNHSALKTRLIFFIIFFLFWLFFVSIFFFVLKKILEKKYNSNLIFNYIVNKNCLGQYVNALLIYQKFNNFYLDILSMFIKNRD